MLFCQKINTRPHIHHGMEHVENFLYICAVYAETLI